MTSSASALTYSTIERVNADICDKLVNMTYTEYLGMINSVVNPNEIDEQGECIWNKQQYKRIVKYVRQAKKNGYKIKQTYSTAFNNDEGRLFVSNEDTNKAGLQNINRFMRGCLSNGIYIDVDMVNAHPTILRYICFKHNIKCDNLTEYINNRDYKINELINESGLDRSDIKTLFIKSINDKYPVTKLGKKAIKNKFFLAFDKEMKDIQFSLMNEYPELKRELMKRGKGNNINGCLVNHLLCKYENEILTDVRKKLGVDMKVLSFDGFMMLESQYDETLLEQLEDVTSKYNIKWSIKEHDLTLYDDILNLSGNYKKFIVGKDLVDIANQLLETELKDKLYCNNEKEIFYLNDDVYISSKDNIKRCLFNWITEQDIYISNNIKLDIPLNNSIKNVNELVSTIMSKAPANNNLLDEIFNDTIRKLYWNNGFYDFEKQEFITDKSKFKTFNKISYDLEMQSNESVRKEIFNKILYPMFGIDNIEEDKEQFNLMEYFLHRLARFMAGCYEDKKWITLMGQRDCGKGVISDLLSKSFGSYISTISSKNFIAKKQNNGNPDLENKFMIKYMFKRLAIAQEMPRNDNMLLSSSSIKGFCSGGDEIEARDVFDKQDDGNSNKKIKLQAGLMMCMNDTINADESDVYEKLEEFNFESKFIDETYNGLKLSNVKYYPKDNNIKSKFLTRQDVINEFALIIIDYYYRTDTKYPETINNENIEEKFETLTLERKLAIIFEQGTEDDFISNADIKNELNKMGITCSPVKFKNNITGIFNCETFKSGIRGYKGLKIR